MTATSGAKILGEIRAQHQLDEGSYLDHAVEMGLPAVAIKNLSVEVPYPVRDVTVGQIVSSLSLCIGLVHVSFIWNISTVPLLLLGSGFQFVSPFTVCWNVLLISFTASRRSNFATLLMSSNTHFSAMYE